MESLKGKNAIITGAGKGIGRAITSALAAEGVHVGLISRTSKDLLELKAELKRFEVKTAIAIADVADILAVNTAVEDIKKELGSIDILINNAGILRDISFQKMKQEDWDIILKVHLTGTYSCSRAAWNIMREQGYGRIVNTASAAGLFGSFGQVNYSAAKLGIHGFSMALAK